MIRRRVSGPLLLLLLLAACGGAPASRGTVSAGAAGLTCEGQVTLRLAWPDALQAGVAGTLRTEEGGVVYPTGTLPSDLVMRVATEGDRRRVHLEAHTVGPSSAHGLMPSMQGIFPDVLLEHDGSVRGIEGGAAMRLALASIAREENADPEQVRLIGEAIADDWLLAHQRTYWELFGKLWAGRTFRCGSRVSLRAPSTEMNFGHVEADVHTELTWLGWQPCAPRPGRDGEQRCAALRATQTVTLDHVALDPTRTPHRVEARRIAELVVEPETLVPRALHLVEETRYDDASALQSLMAEEYEFAYVAPTSGAAAAPTMLAARMPNGHMFYWPADPATGGPVRLPNTLACQQLRACCEALSDVGESHELVCASAVQARQGTDCEMPLRITALTLGLNQMRMPDICTPPPVTPPATHAGET